MVEDVFYFFLFLEENFFLPFFPINYRVETKNFNPKNFSRR